MKFSDLADSTRHIRDELCSKIGVDLNNPTERQFHFARVKFGQEAVQAALDLDHALARLEKIHVETDDPNEDG